MYCGNNAYELENKRLGTRYECFQRGVGVGLNLPASANDLPYESIDRYRIYCGNGRQLPEGYNALGRRSECLRKGVGLGKKLKQQQQARR